MQPEPVEALPNGAFKCLLNRKFLSSFSCLGWSNFCRYGENAKEVVEEED
jgi:hypothetical protein